MPQSGPLRALVAAALGAAALGACVTATPYQPLGARGTGASGGFADVRLAADRYRVTFAGNSMTSRERVETYLLYRAAELTAERGYDGFTIVDRATDRDVETRGPGEVLEVRCGEVGHDGQRPDERPDPGAEPADEEQDADARDDVEELAPRERIDPEPDVGSREKDRPERRMRGEHRAEHRPRPVPGEHAVADPQVLRLVERAEVRTGKEDQTDEDRDGGADHLPGHAALRPRSDSHRTMLIGKSAGAADPLGTEYGRPGR